MNDFIVFFIVISISFGIGYILLTIRQHYIFKEYRKELDAIKESIRRENIRNGVLKPLPKVYPNLIQYK